MEQLPHDIPMPDMMWLEDGGIGIRMAACTKKGIATISIYGDGAVYLRCFL